MKNSIRYLTVFILLACKFSGQELKLPIVKSSSILFGDTIYSYGFSVQNKKTVFCVYRISPKLKITDSLITPISKANPDNYLQCWSDTLHGYLNIYLQEKDKKQVTVFRFNRHFQLLATIPEVDIARLNNTSQFSSEFFYYRNFVYTIRTQPDSSGQQFYLNKYALRSELKNFDYEFKWQFPFERKQIRSAHIFYADTNTVILFVHVANGLKAGQWILKVDAKEGKLIRGTKLNVRGEPDNYLFGTYMADTASKTLTMIGEKFKAAQFSEKENKLNLINRPFTLAYMVTIDSAGDVMSRQDFKIPITTTTSVANKKGTPVYLLRIANAKQKQDGSILFESDIYGNMNNSYCYKYLNTYLFRLALNDEGELALEKTVITSNPNIEKFYFTNDKLDMNGVLCADSVTQFEKVVYKPVVLPVKRAFKSSDEISSWLLERSNTKKNTVTYAILQPKQRIYALTNLDEIPKAENPQLIPVSGRSALVVKQTESTAYSVKLFSW